MPRRRRPISRLSVFYALLLSGLLVGGSVWLDERGPTTMARVTEKRETISPENDPSGGWNRHDQLGVAFTLPDLTPMSAMVTVDSAGYDAFRLGDTVAIRYFRPLPLFARTADRSTAMVLSDVGHRLLRIHLLVWLVAGGVALWLAARLGTVMVVLTGVAWSAVSFPLLFDPPVPVMPAGRETIARVQAIHLVTKSPSSGYSRGRSRSTSMRRLAVPYQVVELRLAVPGQPDSVVAVDAVDSGSVAGLVVGTRLAVRQYGSDPRAARLVGGRRSFVERNRFHFLIPVQIFCLLGVLLAFMRSRKGRRPARAETRAAEPALRAG
jgi:hypothetical protein